MTVDDLFPEDEGGDDHPIMALFIEEDDPLTKMMMKVNAIHQEIYGEPMPTIKVS